MVKYEADTCIRGFATKGYLLAPINHKYGIQTELYGYFKKNDTLKYNTLDDYLDNLDLLSMIPQQLRDIKIRLKEGVKKGITYANESVYPAFDQFEKLQVKNVEDSPFYTQFSEIRKNMPDVTDGQVDHVQIRAKVTILNEILPEFKRLQEYIFGDYRKHLRAEPGISSLPNGDEFYQKSIDYATSLRGVTAEEIHQIGLDEVADLRSRAEKSATEVGMGNLSFPEIRDNFRTDSSFKFNTGMAQNTL